MSARLQFLGATATVTGSRYLVDTGTHRLLVDCGLFQGYKHLRLRNWAPLPVDPGSIDALVLTHAHLDHSGYVPRLVQLGFAGPVYATRSTTEVCGILLPDSGRLLEEDAHLANTDGFSKHHPALPLYTEEHARLALRRFRAVDFDTPFAPVPGLECRFRYAGHLLGAASVHVRVGDGTSVLFSGDLGRPNDALMRAPVAPPGADVVVVESTYGNRSHGETSIEEELAPIVERVARRGGVIVVPTFAVGRAQVLLLLLARLRDAKRIPDIPVFLDSPMAIGATELYLRHPDEHRLDAAECARLRDVATMVRTPEQSRALLRHRGPMIVLSASGMATGGRVLHHLKAYGPDPDNAIVLSGYQAGGTRGAALARGERILRIHGQSVPINAEVTQLTSISAHADAEEILAWLKRLPRVPRCVYVTHGEPEAAEALRLRIARELGWNAVVPELHDTVEL